MPDKTQSARLRELRSVFPANTREVLTIGLSQSPMGFTDELDLVFLVDITGSMDSRIEAFTNTLAGVAAAISNDFSETRYALVTFKDEAETVIRESSGERFFNLATVTGLLTGLVSGGGGDLDEDGYGAIYLACHELPWRTDAARVIVLVTDAASHERGNTFIEARASLLDYGVFFFYGIDTTNAGYSELAEVSRGARLVGTTAEDLEAELIANLRGVAGPVEPPIYLVNDNRDFVATLESGEEVTFVRRSFGIEPFTSGEDGNISIPLKIDNSDLAVTRYLARVRQNLLPVECVIRVYEETDRTGPQNNPPLRLYASDFESRDSVISCQLSWVDLHNAVFPNEYYTPAKCPSLQ